MPRAPAFAAPALLAAARLRGGALRAGGARMSTDGPKAPDGFTPPEPRLAYVKPSALGRVAGGAVALALRGGSGAVVSGYRVGMNDGKLAERSASLPAARPKERLVLFAFPACPFCRKVYEALCMLDLDVLVKPCPKGGKVYREHVGEAFGKQQFPYLEDPNTGFGGYESGDIIDYLFKTYGGQASRPPLALGSAGTLTAGLATAAGGRGGSKRADEVVTAPKPLVVWGYEPSPFCRPVFERLSELELPYVWRTTARGSPSRAELKELTGRVQVPYLEDENTGVAMFESQEIIEYLDQVYGPGAPGAKAEPTQAERESANAMGGAEVVGAGLGAAAAAAASASSDLSPPATTEGGDSKLEEYCDTNPEADECRTYDQ